MRVASRLKAASLFPTSPEIRTTTSFYIQIHTISIYLHRPLFSYGQLDIALSCVGALQLKVEGNKLMTMAHISTDNIV